jgi:hypothetical protein
MHQRVSSNSYEPNAHFTRLKCIKVFLKIQGRGKCTGACLCCSEEALDPSTGYPVRWLLHLINRYWSRLLQSPLRLGVLQINYKYMNAYVMR